MPLMELGRRKRPISLGPSREIAKCCQTQKSWRRRVNPMTPPICFRPDAEMIPRDCDPLRSIGKKEKSAAAAASVAGSN